MILSKIGYIYLLKEREFTKTEEEVYKIGRTEQENTKRFTQYPKGSILIFQIICENCCKIETELLRIFREKFKPRTDIGREYFEGNWEEMMNHIIWYIAADKKSMDMDNPYMSY